jgi:drug/metabolite transporter (DMT)-like permease
VGFVGAALVVTRGDRGVASLGLPATRGDLLILASTLNWAVCTVLSRDPVRRLGSLPATAWSTLFGWALLLPWFVATAAWRPLGHLSAAGWGEVLFLGVGCSGIAYLLWYRALESVDAARVSALLYVEPLVTLVAAVVVLGEPVGWSTVLGGALVLAGVALVQRAPRPA